MSQKRSREKTVLSRQDIKSRRKALNQEKMKVSVTGKRAIGGVLVLALSTLAFLAVATFSAHDRLGPGFHNAIGPVGHALAEVLRGFLGFCAYLLPVAGIYAAGLMFLGDSTQRRWPQVLCLGMLVVTVATLMQLFGGDAKGLSHPAGGVLGRTVATTLNTLVGTVGTVVLMAALAAVALIVGTQFAFLRACALAWSGTQWFAAKAKVWGLEFFAAQKARMAEAKAAREKREEEEAEFLRQLEEQEADLEAAELAAEEAEAIAEVNATLRREAELAREAKEAQKAAQRDEKLAVRDEKQAVRDERQALRDEKLAFREEKQREKLMRQAEKEVTAFAQTVIPQIVSPPAAPRGTVNESMPPLGAADPAWAAELAPQALSMPPPAQPSAPRKAKGRAGAEPPPPPPEAIFSLPPRSAVELSMLENKAAADVAALPGPAALIGAAVAAPAAAVPAVAVPVAAAPAVAVPPAVAAALARTPVIVEPKAPPKPTKKKDQEEFQFHGDRKSFSVPSIEVLEMVKKERTNLDNEAYLSTAEKLRAKLADFGIVGDVVKIVPGPVVTMYEFLPGPGIKISKIASLSDDLAMAMEAMRVRIVAPIPGKGVVGIEVPNKDRETVFLKEIAEQDVFQKSVSKLTMCMGKDIEGMPYVLDLAKAPHMLIAGTTGSGKSVAVNSMIMSILLKSPPEDVRFIMVDPKMLELSVYEGIPHLLLPVVTDPRKASLALQWAVDEMTRRYKLLSDAGVRNITGYNTMVEAEKKKKEAARAPPPKAAESVITSKARPVEAAAVVAAPAVEAPKPEATVEAKPAEGKKKRRLLIVDVGEEAPKQDEAPAAEAAAAVAEATPAPEATLGVAGPAAEQEDPRELSAEVKAELTTTATEAEIRVDETATEQETAALAAAAEGSATPESEQAERKRLPYIVVIIDELADLMMVASKEVETSIARLAQMARAAGIHLMVATQRPSTDVVTGVIKANFPTRISFMLRSKPDSMTILGGNGAEALLGMGDMLIMPPTSAHLQRVHGCFVSEAEIKRAVDHLKAQGKPVFDESILKPREEEGATDGGEEDELSDELYDQAIAIVSEMKQVSISMLQRKMRIGYNRAARMIERMERDGVVGAADGAKPRDVLVRSQGEIQAPM
jgi:DNA segregation ATPase FtsK/SpoIIIE, S-DNA-T family